MAQILSYNNITVMFATSQKYSIFISN